MRIRQAGVVFLVIWSGWATSQAISEVELANIELHQLQLGMHQSAAQPLLQQRYQPSATNQRSGLNCNRQQCTAVWNSPELQENFQVYFNRAGQIYWLSLNRREMLGSSPDDCMQQAQQQLTTLRQQYSPQDQFQRFRPHTVSLMLNKNGHADPVENSLFGFRVTIRCAPYAKGEAQSEFELRDNSLL